MRIVVMSQQWCGPLLKAELQKAIAEHGVDIADDLEPDEALYILRNAPKVSVIVQLILD